MYDSNLVFSMKQIEHCELADKVTQSQGKSKAPTASRLEFKEMKTYGGMPMTDEVVIVTCVHCDKPMIPSAVKEHRSNYLSTLGGAVRDLRSCYGKLRYLHEYLTFSLLTR